jgi:potassium efflux system protein
LRFALPLLAVMSAVLLASAPARGQTLPPPPEVEAAATQVDQADDDLRNLATATRAAGESDTDLKAKQAAIAPIQASLADALSHLTPRLQDTDTRLSQLGPAPAAGQPPENQEIAASRKGLQRLRDSIDTEVKKARLLSVEADQLSSTISQRLRASFSAKLWARNRSIFDPGLWGDFAAALPADVARLASTLADEGEQFSQATHSRPNLALWSIAGLLGFLFIGPARLFLNTQGYKRAGAVLPITPLRRSSLALWLVLVAVVTPLLGALVMRDALASSNAMTEPFDRLVMVVIRAVAFAAFLEGLGRALLSPGRAAWRLAPIDDDVVARLAPYPGLVGAAAGITGVVRGFNTHLETGLATSVASDCLAVLLELAVVGAALAMLGRARSSRYAAAPPEETQDEVVARLPWVIAALATWASFGVAVLAILTGYLSLANFIMRETIWIAVVLASLSLLMRFVDDLFPSLLSPANALGRFIRTAIGVSHNTLEQLGVLLSGIFRLLLLAFGLSAIMAPFGASVGDVTSRVTSTRVVFHLGKVTVSPGAILGGLIVFLVGLALTRAVRSWLESRYLPKTHLDMGVRTSLATGVTYLGAVIAILVTFGYVGLDFSQIALVASALSVGIGFGLQSIIGNFVSGLILLAERPVKVGDWIAIGDLEGDVKRINIRATEIEMADKSKLIVPNTDLISKTVRNVTHGGALGRVKIVIKVEDQADPAAVREHLLGRLNHHAEVLADPAASVYLTDVRDGAQEFTAFAYVASPRHAYRVKSELLFQIVPDLKTAGIVLANSTPVINVGLNDHQIEPTPTPP